jgi:hypothetical protein
VGSRREGGLGWWRQRSAAPPPLSHVLRSIGASPEVVHGDIAGNVLFAPGQPPAVIDLSLYARPVEWSVSVLAVDAVCSQNAPLAQLDTISADPAFPQYLARALLFRMTTDMLRRGKLGEVYDRAAARVLCRVRTR